MQAIPPKRFKVFGELAETVGGSNFQHMRKQMGAVNPPLIPFIGMYLTDITFIEEGSPDNLQTEWGTSLINFGKRYDCKRAPPECSLLCTGGW